MKELKKVYQFTLCTLAPVHIGNGDIYTQKQYIYENGYYYFPNIAQLYKEIENNGQRVVKTFEDFLMQNQNNNRIKGRLVDFLNDQSITTRNFDGYSIKETKFESEPHKRGKINEISKFIKDPYGLPYIPGSSLKGALRSIVLNDKRHGEKDSDLTQVFSNIYVSDSSPIPLEKMILCRKWDYSVLKMVPRGLPVYRESICPLTVIKFKIQAYGQEAIEIIDNLSSTSEKVYRHYKEFFLQEFPDKYVQDNVYAPLYLGAGSGLWTKTSIDDVDLNKFKRGKYAMKRKGVLKLTKAPLIKYKKEGTIYSLIKNNNNFYEMGKTGFICQLVEDN